MTINFLRGKKISIMTSHQGPLKKPEWIRIKHPTHTKFGNMRQFLKSRHHCTVCEAAACPNRAECFSLGTATFLIMGDICTRHCHFCNISKGKPNPLDATEPERLAQSVQEMQLKYVVITSVDRDDLPDGGASHYLRCMQKIRELNPDVKIEILVPDFRGCVEQALETLSVLPPDVFNHNIETVPRLFKTITPGCSYERSLHLLSRHKERFQKIPTKSGLMVGLGETDEEVIAVMDDLRSHQVDFLTIGQYLQPNEKLIPVDRYVTPEQFEQFEKFAKSKGFLHVSSGPLVRSSYHAADPIR
ncbi:MAG: lipoyl synthase [Gammaproteobacteria bacterium]|nr:lipoyl synthase [Gammaproteobacteria bacterium]